MQEPQKPATVYLMDGSAYFYRAYHAIAPLNTRHGLPTNAVFGFTNILLRILRERKPDFLAVAFDAKEPTFRHRMYPAYKANRPPMPEDLAVQLPYIRRVVEGHNILTLEEAGVEADDLIASCCRTITGRGHRVVVLTGDKDLLQLVSEEVTVWDPMNDRWYDPAGVRAKYGLDAAGLLDYFSLIGDSSDNVPGVPGVGPKTAAKLLADCATLEALYADLAGRAKGKLAEKLAENREQALLSRELIRLRDDLPVPADLSSYRLAAVDEEGLRQLYTELEFTRLLKEELTAPAVATDGFALVTDHALLDDICRRAATADLLTVDVETDSLDPLVARLVGVSLCWESGSAYYLAIGHADEEGAPVAGQLDRERVIAALRPLLENDKLPKLGHNLKFDYAVLLGNGIRLAGPLFDTMIASYVLDPVRQSHKLDVLAEELLGVRPTSFAEVTGNDKRADAFVRVDPEAAMRYSCEDVALSLQLWERFRPQLLAMDQWRLFAEVEMPLVTILADMERTGVAVDPDKLADIGRDFAAKIAALEKRIHQLAGHPFNISSPKQLGEVLFDELKLPYGRKTKTGYSTDVRVLEGLAHRHPLPAAVIEHRTLVKLQTTYVDKLRDLIHPVTGRVHTSFNQTVTATGRLSSSNPNLQNIPVRSDEGMRIRSAFVAPAGSLFLAADYSQIDLRVMAHYSGDPELCRAFRAGEDIHDRTAAEIFRVDPNLVTKEMRRVAKTINFGIVYGMSAFGLASQLGVSRKEAAVFIDRYFSHYAGVRRFMEEIVEEGRRRGYAATLLNRRRLLPDINSRNKTVREFAERTAINTPIQGTAADIIKLATIGVRDFLRDNGLAGKLVLQIHDELVLEVEEEEIERTRAGLRQVMEGIFPLDVPLLVNVDAGPTLADV
ncbi:MAG: DNA polymerase I [Thermodesulfobacteriota bacterium]